MRRVCYLHIGLPKTGTTAIQHGLRACRADFAAHGFFIPQTGLAPHHGGHNGLALWLGGDPRLEKTGPRFAMELNASDAEVVVISSEKIAKRLLNRDFITTLFDRLWALNLEPRIIMTVRNQPQLFNSAFGQLTKSFRWSGTFEEFLTCQEITAPTFNMHIADAIAAYDAPLIVLGHSSDIMPSFLAAIGAPDLALTCAASQRINQSVGPLTVEVARTVQRELPQLTAPESNECWRILKAILHRTGLADVGYCGLTTQTAREIEMTFADHNNAFAARVWGRQWAEVFGSEIGREFQPNDYQITGVPSDTKATLSRLTTEAKEQCEEILTRRRP